MADRSRSIARMQFLGSQRIEIGTDVLTAEAELLFAMVVRLSVPLGRMTSRQTMMDTLWPGVDDANGRHNLRQTVYKARELGMVIESGEDGLRLDPRHWSCDWDDAAGDIAGEWLADYEPAFSEELCAWIAAQRIGVHAMVRPRIMKALQTARSAGDLRAADRYATQLLMIDELNEEATLTRAEFMALQGSKVDALKLLDAYLEEIGSVGAGRDAALPAQLLRRRIAEKLPAVSYQNGSAHPGPLVARHAEYKRLMASLFDARAGRGPGILLYGPDGSGKSRLLHELRKAALIQGMRVLELRCTRTPTVTPFVTLRELVTRLLDRPGALGVSPECLGTLREWVASRAFAPDDCPLDVIEDLLAAVSEETPFLLSVEHAECMDAESLGRLDRIYRRGVQRHHVMVLTSSSLGTPTESPVTLRWIDRIALRPMATMDVRAVVEAYATAEQPRATSDQISCAAVFAEGIPMYGIEMLGLILDEGSPDVIPWRVQVAVDRALRDLTELQWRILALGGLMGVAAQQALVAQAIGVEPAAWVDALDGLETAGLVTCEDGVLRVSQLMADAAEKRLKPPMLRGDAVRAGEGLRRQCQEAFAPRAFYAGIRLFTAAADEGQAAALVDQYAGQLLSVDSAQNIVFELTKLSRTISSVRLAGLLSATIEHVRRGSERHSIKRKGERRASIRPGSLPLTSSADVEIEYTISSAREFLDSLAAARNPDAPPSGRIAEAIAALVLASNLHDPEGLRDAYAAVGAVRHAKDVDPFDVCRADLIYSVTLCNKTLALEHAESLARESRRALDLERACVGMRNAAEAFTAFGANEKAQALLLEARGRAQKLEYHAQAAMCDLRLADLSIFAMDQKGARSYIISAERLIDTHAQKSLFLLYDLNFLKCWSSITEADLPSAQRAFRAMIRVYKGPVSGTTRIATLSTKLATFRGRPTAATEREFRSVMAAIVESGYNFNQELCMFGALEYSKRSGRFAETAEIVFREIPRLEETKGPVWPTLTSALEGTWQWRD